MRAATSAKTASMIRIRRGARRADVAQIGIGQAFQLITRPDATPILRDRVAQLLPARRAVHAEAGDVGDADGLRLAVHGWLLCLATMAARYEAKTTAPVTGSTICRFLRPSEWPLAGDRSDAAIATPKEQRRWRIVSARATARLGGRSIRLRAAMEPRAIDQHGGFDAEVRIFNCGPFAGGRQLLRPDSKSCAMPASQRGRRSIRIRRRPPACPRHLWCRGRQGRRPMSRPTL